MADHLIHLKLTVRTAPDLATLKYKVGDTLTFVSDDGDVRSQCSCDGMPAIALNAKKGEKVTVRVDSARPYLCNCGLTLADGRQVGWPDDLKAGSQTGGTG